MEVSGRKPVGKKRGSLATSQGTGAQAAPTKQTAGSGNVQNVCDPCDLRGHRKSPDGYCLDCGEYLCTECFKVHLYPQPCRDHDLLDARRMPRQKIPPVEACMTHRDEKLKFYCKDHATAACNSCIMLQHRRCENVCPVSEMSSNANVEQRCKDLRQKISTLQQRTDNHRQLGTKNVSKIEFSKKQTKANIKAFCKRMHQKLYELEENVDADVDEIGDEDRNKIDRIFNDCDTLRDDLEIVSVMLDNNHSPGKKDKLFITVEKADDTLRRVEDKLKALAGDNVVKDYTFEPDDRLKNLIENVNELGHLFIKTPGKVASPSTKAGKQIWNTDNVTGQRKGEINVRSTSDKMTCWITGSAMLQGGTTLAIADCGNKAVKLVDVIKMKLVSDIHLPGSPWDITEVQQNQLAVTLHRQCMIQFLRLIGTPLSLDNAIKTSQECHGITCFGDQLIVSFATGKQVQILSMSGTILKTFVNDTDGQPLFSGPFYVCVHPDRSLLYVSNFSGDCVICITTDGQVKGKYTHTQLESPEQITSADDGSVFVTCFGSNSVHVISADCKHGRIVVDKNQGLGFSYSLSYSRSQESLYIGKQGSDILQMFKLV